MIGRRGTPVVWVLAALLALALASCGGGSERGAGSRPRLPRPVTAVDVYVSLPLRGPQAALTRPAVEGAELAWRQAGGRAGRFRVNLRVLDAARPVARGAGSAPAADAARAATDPGAVLYIGEFTSEASAISMPILAQAGIPMLSPTSAGVTPAAQGRSVGGAPDEGIRSGSTFFRLMPSDAVEAAGELLALHRDRCARVAVAHDGSAYGQNLASLLALGHGAYGISVVSDSAIGPQPASLRAYAQRIKLRGAECLVFAGTDASTAVNLIGDVHELALPTAPVIVPARLCTRRVTDPAYGGIPAALGPILQCTRPVLAPQAYPGGRRFVAAFRAAYRGMQPGADAIFGYEAMQLALATIDSLGANGADRAAILARLHGMTERRSVLGTYRFDAGGETTLDAVGLYRVDPATHAPVFLERLIAPPVGGR